METKNNHPSQEEKLKAIIQKAVKGGYAWDKYHSSGQAGQEGFAAIAILLEDYDQLFFSHDFAKAFFKLYGEGAWTYHLQQLALTPPVQRIDYFINL